MKPGILIGAIVASLCGVHGTVFDLDLGGPAGPGLLPGNEVPPNSTGASGGQFSPLQYNDVTDQLTMNLFYQNLSDAFTGAHIHGPASTTASAGILYDLNALGLVNQTSAAGGNISGT